MSETYSIVENITNVNIYTCTCIYRSEHMGSQRSIVFLIYPAWMDRSLQCNNCVRNLLTCLNTKLLKVWHGKFFYNHYSLLGITLAHLVSLEYELLVIQCNVFYSRRLLYVKLSHTFIIIHNEINNVTMTPIIESKN